MFHHTGTVSPDRKIEHYHRSMKNVIKLRNYEYPRKLEMAFGEFVENYNKHLYHESHDNLTPEDVYFGREEKIKDQGSHINAPEKVEPGSSPHVAIEPQSVGGNTLFVQAHFCPKCSEDLQAGNARQSRCQIIRKPTP